MITTALTRPDIKTGKALLIVGFRQVHKREEMADGILGQWQLLRPYFGSLTSRVGQTSYGILCGSDRNGNTEYMCGLEVSDFAEVPPELDHLQILRQTYAVFTHEGHVSALQRTWQTIWEEWYPHSSYNAANSPDFERYDETYDHASGNGSIEMWFPITN
ncbi:MAG: AraC family transcriptional regulator [Hyphomicrobiales bacterium]|nr:AraC family transcriptional regulator [Hyphomicrobiales bacterium]MCP4999953.1 AraC family transcriptional regulator [Hyphomicrobiales bacterium]